MSTIREDLLILNKFNFKRPPVGVKFSLFNTKLAGVERIGKPLNICEMVPEAQKGKPFYAMKEDITCAAPLYLGMHEKGEPVMESGGIGAKLEAFHEPRVNRQLYDVIARLPVGVVKYVAFAPLDKLPFDPDVLIVTADPAQAGALLRVTTYLSLKLWHSVRPPVIECNWLFIHPFLTGEVFYISAFDYGFALGRIRPGTIIISFPYQFLLTLVYTLREIPWEYEKLKIMATRPLEFKKKMQEIVSEVAAEVGMDAKQRFESQ